ncbi:hypothetical protein PoB_006813100 [Plakobranchus ocellatus]|uniref:Uncharacterized protein n=1 Tax=Plakobranchus ocellatus TaxID=259542 RepID=A0AAV4DCH9_9GAST|nr:hypothetical protein PoB_006813100 [Plakobranchus ocellatus]
MERRQFIDQNSGLIGHRDSGRLNGQRKVTLEDLPGSVSRQWKRDRAVHCDSAREAGRCIVTTEERPCSAS